ncbi:hypothetical protein FisN_25Hh101 [Fistulifera solaris]|uniref:Enhancer of polycomb-like protein n=1 Tax=Fistulifera solaris TaxID=1519565 RepID=A0A1Z5JVP8_FISSO|nr:hypothetical protein FisN_25Hh101 [Fistulifera solaris]|eukprot:GAX18120.1 hypothetical protein FisN_25Hh101 [Fistulifera solaris]
MSNPAVAPNSLNVYKRVTIIRHEDDKVTFEDSSGTTKSLSVKDFQHVLSAVQAPTEAKQVKSDIPVPEINEVETYAKDIPATYDIKNSYIRYHHATEKEWKNRIDYVADAEDEQWLNENSKLGEAARVKAAETGARPALLSLELLEAIIDALEKATAFDSIVTIQQAETLILEKLPELADIFPAMTQRGQGGIKFKHMMQEVYNYWVSKRSKLKRPLLRRYWPVTSTDDTNPHLVFRPREKEKYKLRKKRQNDMEAFQKMSWLRHDFDNLRATLELVQRREELHRLHVQLQMERFQQRIHEVCDTSTSPRESSLPDRSEIKRLLDVPEHFDSQFGGRKAKRGRDQSTDGASSYAQSLPLTASSTGNKIVFNSVAQLAGPDRTNIAGRNHGEPAPNFLQPLETRETYVSSWQNAVPYVTAYENAQVVPITQFRKRPRVGRGGRICIDRVPLAPPPAGVPPLTIVRAGLPLPRTNASSTPKHLLDLLPRPIDALQVKRHIEGLTMAALREEDLSMNQPPAEEADADQVLVRMDDWLDTDEQLWGEEKFVVGPL